MRGLSNPPNRNAYLAALVGKIVGDAGAGEDAGPDRQDMASLHIKCAAFLCRVQSGFKAIRSPPFRREGF